MGFKQELKKVRRVRNEVMMPSILIHRSRSVVPSGIALWLYLIISINMAGNHVTTNVIKTITSIFTTCNRYQNAMISLNFTCLWITF